MTKDKLVSVRLPDDLHDKVKAQADIRGVTMSAYVRSLIDKKLGSS